MSTINVNRVVDASGGVLAPISSVMRNRIINGAMVIDQRNAGASVTPTDATTLDRWQVREDTDGAISLQQVSDAPAGFSFSQKITTTTADASLTGIQRLYVEQPIEGFNTADFAFGTANAKTVTLSFWVKSSLTGTFAGTLQNSARDRSYVYNYTISAANTWEYKTVTIAGDTTGTWVGATNGLGLRVVFSLGVGADYTGTANSWQGGTRLYASSGAVSVIGTLSATWQVTGVQLEVGTQATSFEYRQYQQELALCQRYYYKITSTSAYGALSGYAPAVSGTLIYNPINLPVTMRASPSSLESANIQVLDGVTTYTGGSFAIDTSSNNPNCSVVVYTHGSSSFSQYRTYGYRGNNNTAAYLAFSAEL